MSDYETITLDPYEQRNYDLSPGETFSNVLIDQSAEGAMFSIRADDNIEGWAVKNVGWKGFPENWVDRDFGFHMRLSSAGMGEVENVFFDGRDHAGGGPGTEAGFQWIQPWHEGHIDCRHNFVAGPGNNCAYDENAGRDSWAPGGDGTVRHYRSYHRDATPSAFRPGTAGSSVEQCVVVANDPDGKRGTYPGNPGHGSQLTRACWAWNHENITMRDCAIWWDPDDVQTSQPFWATHRSDESHGDDCVLTVENCDINASWDGGLRNGGGSVDIISLGNDPSVEVLGEGVPLSPEMAARGERALPPALGTAPGGGHETIDWSDLRVEAAEDAQRVIYELAVNGRAELGPRANPGDEMITDTEWGAKIEGVVLGGGVDTFRTTGGVIDATVQGAATVTLDSEVVVSPSPSDGGTGGDTSDGDSGDDSAPSEPVSETIRVDVSDGQDMVYKSVELRVEADESLSIQTVDD